MEKSSETMEFDLNLSLFSKTPVVDCELQPKVQLVKKKLPIPPKYSFKWNWCRSKEKVTPTCCVHHCKKATIECIYCVNSGLPVEKNYYCSSKCFGDDWKNHRVRHPELSVDDIKGESAGKLIDSSYSEGSWPRLDSASESGSESSGTATEGDESWIEIGSSKTYKPTLHDFGYRLKLQSQAVDCEGLPLTQTEVIVTDPIIIRPAPCPRRMIPVGPHCAGTFSILTYNILADYYDKSLHPYCPTWALTWQYRRQNLLREIIGYDADILCLQEVQNDHFDDFFKPELEKHGYSVSYHQKTTTLFIGKETTDGCATFFRHNRFTEITTSKLEFRQIANLAHRELSQQEIAESKRLLKGNVAVIVTLKDKENGAVFCVANTHIHADPEKNNVKAWQVATLINELEKVYDSNIPVLVCGDLNSLPRSAPHELVVRGRVDRLREGFADISDAMLEHVKLTHEMRLVSAYSSILNNTTGISISKDQIDKMDPATNEPVFTNLTLSFNGAIDYIFYSEGAFTVKSLLELVDRQSMKEYIVLPTPYWSSDHIALMAEFYITPQDNRN